MNILVSLSTFETIRKMNPFVAGLNKDANGESPGEASSSVPNKVPVQLKMKRNRSRKTLKVTDAKPKEDPIKQMNPKGRPKEPKAKKPKGKQTPKVSKVVMGLKLKDSLKCSFDVLEHTGTWDDMRRSEVPKTVLEPKPQRFPESPIASGLNSPLIYNKPKLKQTISDVMNLQPGDLNWFPVSSGVQQSITPYVFTSGPKQKRKKWKQINNGPLIRIGCLSTRSGAPYNLKLKWPQEGTHLLTKYGEDYGKNLQEMEEVLKWSSDNADDILLEDLIIKQLSKNHKKADERNSEIARKLRVDYIRGHNMKLKRIEGELNGASKITISLEKFYLTEEGHTFVKTYPNSRPKRKFRFGLVSKVGLIPSSDLCLIAKHEGNFTKNIFKFFPDFHLEMPKTAICRGFNFDPTTTDAIRTITKSSISGIVGEGKEAVILHAYSKEANSFQLECVFKVFKLTANKRDVYFEKDELQDNRSFRKHSWLCAQKEKNNLMRMWAVGIPCPRVFILKQNVLMTSFIGKNGNPAPKLKDAVMSNDDYLDAYLQIIKGMELFHKAGLVHADLSEKNILWHNGRCYFIDVSQSVTYSHKHALKFLHKDCCKITEFFYKKPILHQPTPNDLFYFITGRYYEIKTREKKGKKGKAEQMNKS